MEDEHRVEEGQEYHAELVLPRVDAPPPLESAEQPFDLVPQLADVFVEIPWVLPVRLRRHDRRHSYAADESVVRSPS